MDRLERHSLDVAAHYRTDEDLTQRIRAALAAAGRPLDALTTRDLAPVDEFHVRGRQATIELAGKLGVGPASRVLDIGSGLGGPARAVAETYGSTVVGIDLSAAYCQAAAEMSRWVGLDEQVRFVRADATALPFVDASFDAVMTIHAAMNIRNKRMLYEDTRRVLRPGGVLAIFDVVLGDGGPVVFPVPWARDPSISHLATAEEMRGLLATAGLAVVEETDSTEGDAAWFERVVARMLEAGPFPVSLQLVLGPDFPEMARNQARNLVERRIRTVTFVCRA